MSYGYNPPNAQNEEEKTADEFDIRDQSVSKDAILTEISPVSKNSYLDVVSNFTSPYPELDPKLSLGVLDIYDSEKDGESERQMSVSVNSVISSFVPGTRGIDDMSKESEFQWRGDFEIGNESSFLDDESDEENATDHEPHSPTSPKLQDDDTPYLFKRRFPSNSEKAAARWAISKRWRESENMDLLFQSALPPLFTKIRINLPSFFRGFSKKGNPVWWHFPGYNVKQHLNMINTINDDDDDNDDDGQGQINTQDKNRILGGGNEEMSSCGFEMLWKLGATPRDVVHYYLMMIEYGIRMLPVHNFTTKITPPNPEPTADVPSPPSSPPHPSSSSSSSSPIRKSSIFGSSRKKAMTSKKNKNLKDDDSMNNNDNNEDDPLTKQTNTIKKKKKKIKQTFSEIPLKANDQKRKLLTVIDLSWLQFHDSCGIEAIQTIQLLMGLLSDHYPGRCEKVIFLDAPGWFNMIEAMLPNYLFQSLRNPSSPSSSPPSPQLEKDKKKKNSRFRFFSSSDPKFWSYLNLDSMGGDWPKMPINGPDEFNNKSIKINHDFWSSSQEIALSVLIKQCYEKSLLLIKEEKERKAKEEADKKNKAKKQKNNEEEEGGDEGGGEDDKDDDMNTIANNMTLNSTKVLNSLEPLEGELEMKQGPIGEWQIRSVILDPSLKLFTVLEGKQSSSSSSEDVSELFFMLGDIGGIALTDMDDYMAQDDGQDSGSSATHFSFFHAGDMFEFNAPDALEAEAWVEAIKSIQDEILEEEGGGNGGDSSHLANIRDGEEGRNSTTEERDERASHQDDNGVEVFDLNARFVYGEEEFKPPLLQYPLADILEVEIDLTPTPGEIAAAADALTMSSTSTTSPLKKSTRASLSSPRSGRPSTSMLSPRSVNRRGASSPRSGSGSGSLNRGGSVGRASSSPRVSSSSMPRGGISHSVSFNDASSSIGRSPKTLPPPSPRSNKNLRSPRSPTKPIGKGGKGGSKQSHNLNTDLYPIRISGISFLKRKRMRNHDRLIISKIDFGSAGEASGLKVGDVILAANETTMPNVEDSLRKLSNVLQLRLQEAARMAMEGNIQLNLPTTPGHLSKSASVTARQLSASNITSPRSSSGSGSTPSRQRKPPPAINTHSRSRSMMQSHDSVMTTHTPSTLPPPVRKSTRGSEPRPLDSRSRARSNDQVDRQAVGKGGKGKSLDRGSRRLSGSTTNGLDKSISSQLPESGTLKLKVWRVTLPEGRQGGVDLSINIDMETRGMHVQQPDIAGPITIVGATGDAEFRGMREGDILIGVHHIPLPGGATLSHVQGLMESLPRPLTLNLFRSSPYDDGNFLMNRNDQNDQVFCRNISLFPSAGVWISPNECLQQQQQYVSSSTSSSSPVSSSSIPNQNNTPKLTNEDDDKLEGYYRMGFFPSIVRAHKSYILSEMHLKEDPTTNSEEERAWFL